MEFSKKLIAILKCNQLNKHYYMGIREAEREGLKMVNAIHCPICDPPLKSIIEVKEGKEIAILNDVLEKLREIRNRTDFPLRSSFNRVCDHLDLIICQKSQDRIDKIGLEETD